MAALAISVVDINGIPQPTPINERQIEMAVSELGDCGLRAVAELLGESDDSSSLFERPSEGNAAGTLS